LRCKGYAPGLASEVLEKLCRSRYAGDASFAREWTRFRADGRGYGPGRIAQELRAKGVDEAAITQALRETFGGNDERERAARVLEKRFRPEKLADPTARRRAAAFLQRRGYSETLIESLLRLD
jgi:regulatory protein